MSGDTTVTGSTAAGSTASEFSMVVGRHAYVQQFRDDPPHLASGRLVFDDSYRPTHTAFEPMAEEQRFAFSEMAIATLIQARSFGKDVWLLPVTLIGRFQHGNIHVSASSAITDPRELAGRRIAVRAYSQTTGLWVRAFLREQFGLDAREITWVTFESAHLREYVDPADVRRARSDADMWTMLRGGEVDAVIASTPPADGSTRPLLASAGRAAQDWYRRTSVVPINHVLTVAGDTMRGAPDVVRRVTAAVAGSISAYRSTTAGAASSQDEGWEWLAGVDLLPQGEDLQRAADRAIAECHRQGLIDRRISVDELCFP